ncbi:MAG: zinc permease [Bacteroidota bacterium]
MYIQLFILFSIPLLAGLSIYFLPSLSKQIYHFSLVFGGSYLFSFLLVHMLPELFESWHKHYQMIGLYLLIGFFLQIFLDFLSGGIAHGHSHSTKNVKTAKFTQLLPLVLGLSIHALLDGILLSFAGTPSIGHCHHHHHHHVGGLLFGIVLHKMPISFILSMLLKGMNDNKKINFLFLLLFCLASPAGWLLANALQASAIFSSHALLAINAVAVGSLLHIATTILFESSPEHHFNAKKLVMILSGGILAVVMTHV